MPLSCARAAARAGPSTSWRELWRGASWAMGGAPSLTGRSPARGESRGGDSGVRRGGGAARGLRLAGATGRAREPAALPLAEAPEVALDLPGVDLAAGQVEVGLGDQAALVPLERHPLRQHVVGVGQPRGAVGARLV